MKYSISDSKAPVMPNLGSGTEAIKLLLSQASKDMYEPLVPMLFPVLGAHLCGVTFQYPDFSKKEMTGMMAHLVADSGCNKGQLTLLVEALCRDLRQHDDGELRKLVEWQKQIKTKSSNSAKPVRPEVAFWFPPSDVTNAAFIQNAMACESLGNRSQFINMTEVEMADRVCGGHKQVSQMMRNIYDKARAGALRATADGITGNPTLRVNLTFSSTPFAARQFYKYELLNGTFGRVVFSYKPRIDRDGRIPRLGKFSEEFYRKLDAYLARLDICKGEFVIKPLNNLIDRLSIEWGDYSDLADDNLIFDVGKRSLVSAWKAGCILWVLNGQTWTRAMGEMVEWLVYHDIWSKMQLFADMLFKDANPLDEAQRRGPRNMLEDLPDSFNEKQLEALRVSLGKSPEGTGAQLRKWVFRKFVTFCAQTGLYSKTNEYLKGRP